MVSRWHVIKHSVFLGSLSQCCFTAGFSPISTTARSSLTRAFIGSSTWSTCASRTRGLQVEAKDSVAEGLSSFLVVGDGDLSYSAALSGQLEREQVSLCATVLEKREIHNEVYRNSEQHIATIAQSNRQIVKFGVDATSLSSHFETKFDRIIFNFPHWRGKSNNRYNRQLLNEFLCSAKDFIKANGEIHVALCEGQGGTEARTTEEWRGSWMAAMYAADHGLLLRRIDQFQDSYDLSSHRGVDRPFTIGRNPSVYVFGLPNGEPIDTRLQVACRHELRIKLEPNALETKCPFSREELVDGDVISDLAAEVASSFPGIRVENPMRDLVVPSETKPPLLVSLIVASGESMPLTRATADQLRAALEDLTVSRLGLEIAKPGRMVSKPFPLQLMDTLTAERI